MNNKGIALIMAVGVLALLAIIATSFALNMRLEYHAAMNYYNGVKARYFAESALERAIAELRTHVKSSAFDDTDEAWAQYGYSNIPGDTNKNPNGIDLNLHLLSGTGTSLTTTVKDEQRKVNINNANALNNANDILLTNLFTECGVTDPAGLITKIRNGKPSDGYHNLTELKALAEITDADFNRIKDYITTSSYEDANTSNAPVNVNTCSDQVLKSVILNISDGTNTVSDATAAMTAIKNARPLSTWTAFNTTIDNAGMTLERAALIKNNCNPNRTNPTTFTTEFCFNSGGYYSIKTTGTVTNAIGGTLATDTLAAIAKIYDIIYISSKEDFRGEDANYNSVLDSGEDTNGNLTLDCPTYQRVTWMDECPVNASSLFNQYAISNPEYIEGALKIGYWDDFDEDVLYSQHEWTGPYAIGTPGIEPDNVLYSPSDYWPIFLLQDAAKWTWTYNTLRVYVRDDDIWAWWDPQMKDVGWVQCNGSSVLLARQGPLAWGSFYYDIGGVCTYNEGGTTRWIFPSQLRRIPYNGDINLYWTQVTSYTPQKVLVTTNSSASASATVYCNGGDTKSITYPAGGATTFQLYGQGVHPYMDDLRIISSDGNYTSISYSAPTGTDVTWGTIAFTGTEQTNTTISMALDTGSGFNTATNGGAIGSNPKTASIKYRVDFTSGGNMQNTPILEDITITYLSTVRVKY